MDKKNTLQVVVETPEFIKQAKECMDEQSKADFITFIAQSSVWRFDTRHWGYTKDKMS